MQLDAQHRRSELELAEQLLAKGLDEFAGNDRGVAAGVVGTLGQDGEHRDGGVHAALAIFRAARIVSVWSPAITAPMASATCSQTSWSSGHGTSG